jgi:hypothetical protein
VFLLHESCQGSMDGIEPAALVGLLTGGQPASVRTSNHCRNRQSSQHLNLFVMGFTARGI